MSAKPSIVVLPPHRWEAYRQLRLHALASDPQAFGSTYAESVTRPDSTWRDRLAKAEQGDCEWLLFAQVGEELVGLVGASRSDRFDEAEMISMFVQADHRGCGVGAQLVEALLIRLEAAQIRRVTLAVRPSQSPAIRLYKRMGFGFTGEEMDGELLMARCLYPPAALR